MEKTLNEELINVSNWLKANKLSLNVKKSNVLLFRPKNESKKKQATIDLKIDGAAIEEKQSAKYLGLYFDNKMTFKEHVNHIITKLKKGNGILAKLRYFVPEEVIYETSTLHILNHIITIGM